MRPVSRSTTCRRAQPGGGARLARAKRLVGGWKWASGGKVALGEVRRVAMRCQPLLPRPLPHAPPRHPMCQAGMGPSSAKTVLPQAEVTFHWPSSRCKQLLQVQAAPSGDSSLWCSPFGIPTGENFVVKVRRPARDQWEYLHVEVKLVEPVVFIVFREGRTEHAPVMVQVDQTTAIDPSSNPIKPPQSTPRRRARCTPSIDDPASLAFPLACLPTRMPPHSHASPLACLPTRMPPHSHAFPHACLPTRLPTPRLAAPATLICSLMGHPAL